MPCWVVIGSGCIQLSRQAAPEASALAAFEDVSMWVAQPQRAMHNAVMEMHLIMVDD